MRLLTLRKVCFLAVIIAVVLLLQFDSDTRRRGYRKEGNKTKLHSNKSRLRDAGIFFTDEMFLKANKNIVVDKSITENFQVDHMRIRSESSVESGNHNDNLKHEENLYVSSLNVTNKLSPSKVPVTTIIRNTTGNIDVRSAIGNLQNQTHDSNSSAVPTKSPCAWMNRVKWKPTLGQHDVNYIINPKHICNWTRSGSSNTKNVNLLILVSSGIANVKRREAVRSTWLGWSIRHKMPTRTLFLLGASRDEQAMSAVRQEAEIHGDILQEDFIDSYYNLTLKTVMAFKWAATFCNHSDFVLKMDDDGLLNIESLIKNMSSAPQELRQNYIAGARMGTVGPIRSSGSKWCIPKSMYLDNLYAPYPLGVGYIFSIDLAHKLFQASKEIVHFPIDDVFVGMLLKKIGVELRHKSSFYSFTITFSKSIFIKSEASLLALRKGYLTWNVSPSLAQVLWNAIINNRWEKLEGNSTCGIKCVENAGYLP